MKLNKATSHALRVLVGCARADGGLQKVADLSADLGLTQQNTFKIVHLLSRAGFVEGERGRYGGVRLKNAPSKIRVGDVVRAMESLPDSEHADSDTAGGHGAMFDEAFEAFVSVLNQTTIADMLAARHAKPKPDAKPTKKKAKRSTNAAAAAKRAPRRNASLS